MRREAYLLAIAQS